MKWWRDARVWWVAGGTAAASALVVLFGAVPRKRRLGTVIDGWEVLEGPEVILEPGAHYRAVIDIPGIVPTGLVVGGIEDKAPLEGFGKLTMSEERPPGWIRDPAIDGVDADLFVDAVYEGARRPFSRPGAVVLAWREVEK